MVLIFLFGVGMAPSWGSPQTSQHNADMKMLEAGLGGLKESYAAVADRNDRLLSDIAAYAQNIELLRQELKRLDETKAGLLEGRPPMQNIAPSIESEESLQMEIERLSKELNSLSQDTLEKALRSQQEVLMSSIEKNKDGIKNKEADLNKMSRQYEKPLKKIDSLKAEQISLKLKVAALQDKLKKKIEGSERPGPLSSRKDRSNEDRLSLLNSDLVRLRLYQQRLTKDILKRIQGVSSADFNYERDLWDRKVNALQVENDALKEEIIAIRGFHGGE